MIAFECATRGVETPSITLRDYLADGIGMSLHVSKRVGQEIPHTLATNHSLTPCCHPSPVDMMGGLATHEAAAAALANNDDDPNAAVAELGATLWS